MQLPCERPSHHRVRGQCYERDEWSPVCVGSFDPTDEPAYWRFTSREQHWVSGVQKSFIVNGQDRARFSVNRAVRSAFPQFQHHSHTLLILMSASRLFDRSRSRKCICSFALIDSGPDNQKSRKLEMSPISILPYRRRRTWSASFRWPTFCATSWNTHTVDAAMASLRDVSLFHAATPRARPSHLNGSCSLETTPLSSASSA